MATVVGLRNGQLRNWTGSLSDLDGCENSIADYPESTAEGSPTSFLDWKLQSSTTMKASGLSNISIGLSASINDQEKKCWKIKQFLHSLQRSQGHVTADQLKHLPLTLFSPVLDRAQNEKDRAICPGYYPASNLVSSHTTSESELNNVAADERWDKSLCYNLHLMRLLKTSRRHYNSESDLTNNFPDPEIVNPIVKRPILDLPSSLMEIKKLTELAGDKIPTATPTTTLLEQTTSLIQVEDVKVLDSKLSGGTSILPAVTEDSILLEPNAPCEKPEIDYQDESELTEEISSQESPPPETQLRSSLKGSSDSLSELSTLKLSKSVSFADEVGQELAEVFVIETTENKILEYDTDFDGLMWNGSRRSRFHGFHCPTGLTRSRLKKRSMTYPEEQPLLNVASNTETNCSPKPDGVIHTRSLWVLKFSQPAAKYYEFRQKVENGSCSLENITLIQPEESSATQLPQLSGTIKVKNLSFEKQVWIRLTVDNWQSFTDYVALYSPKLSSGLMHSISRFDTFTFHLNVVPQLENPEKWDRIEFAIRYLVGPDGLCGQYWDSNGGVNYVIERKIVQSNWPSNLGDAHRNHHIGFRGENTLVDESKLGEFACVKSQHRPYTPDYRPNFEGISQFTNYRAWRHFSEETAYY